MNTFIQNMVVEAVKNQPWYQRNANTIVAGIGFFAALLTFVATLPLNLPDQVHAALPVVVAFLTAVAIKFTPNGVQLRTADKLERTETAHKPIVQGVGTSILAAELDRVRGHVAEVVDEYTGQHRADPEG